MSPPTRRGVIPAHRAPVGSVVEVFGFTTPDGYLNGHGAFHEGRLVSVEALPGEFLNTRLMFEGGGVVYARQYATTRVHAHNHPTERKHQP